MQLKTKQLSKKLYLYSLLTATAFSLAACGGTTDSPTASTNTSHPEFSWAKVAVSNNYSPSGDISDLTPTFSWEAVSGATIYNIGHESTNGGDNWKEYTVPAAEAGCAKEPTCSYKPADQVFNVGDQKAWWVRGSVSNQWQAWSDSHVFQIIDGSGGGGNTTTPVVISPESGSTVTNNKPTFSWEAIQNAKSITIGIEKQNGTGWRSFKVDPQKTMFASPNNIPDGDYTWWIRAEKQDGSWTNWSNWSNGSDFTIDSGTTPVDTVAPTTPKNLRLGLFGCRIRRDCPDLTSNYVHLNWEPSTDNISLASYNLYRDGVKIKTIDATNLSSYVDKTVKPETSYTYTVSAVDSSDNESHLSNEFTVTTLVLDTQAPSTPDNVTAELINRSNEYSIKISWDASFDVDGQVEAYNIYRDGILLFYRPAYRGLLYYFDRSIVPGKSYTYTITALDEVQHASEESSPVTIAVPVNLDTEAPSTPINLRIVNVPNYSPRLQWDPSTDNIGVTGYKIFLDGLYSGSHGPNAFATSWSLGGVTDNNQHTFEVVAFDAAGNESYWSDKIIYKKN